MGAFDCFLQKEELISRAYDIDEYLYKELKHLSKKKYNCSVSNLVNASIKYLIETENIGNIVQLKIKSNGIIHRSFLLNKSLFDGLEILKEKYNIPICRLVNIGIYISLNSNDINN